METHAKPDANAAPTPASPPAADGLVDVDAILREVEALAGIAVKDALAATNAAPTSSAPTTMSPATASATTTDSNLDVAALEREIESLLRGTASSNPGTTSSTAGTVAVPSADAFASEASAESHEAESHEAENHEAESPAATSPEPDVRSAVFATPSVDPMLRELEEILDDSNDAVLRNAGGSIDRALDTVFDPRALSGQEEEVNRALIEAFGTSRRSHPAFASTPAVVTNPVPRFEGISRAVPPEVSSESSGAQDARIASAAPVRTFEEIAAKSIARSTKTEYAGETPFEPAFPAVPPLAASESVAATAVSGIDAATNPAPTIEPNPIAASSTPTTAKAAVPMTSPVIEPAAATVVPAAKPRFSIAPLLRRIGGLASSVALLPLQLCSLPMRAVPASARSYVGIAAVSMALWVPVAWWMAQRSASAPGIGRVEFPVATTHDHAGADAADASDTTAGETEHADAHDASHAGASAGSSSATAHH